MESWAGREPVALPGRGPALRLHDSVSGTVRATSPGATARMYVCGITPYDATHLGHAATFVAFDLINRIWRDAGHDVHYVQNVTDVDDPLLERAGQLDLDWRDLARAQIEQFRRDMEALNVLPPQDYVGAVEAIPSVVRWIHAVRASGHVYDLDSDLYFSVAGAPGFGEISGLGRAAMLGLSAERGGDPERPGKRDPLDCVLWQAPRPGEPAWESDLGPGRPGWHVECTAIALDHLGMAFDVQGGGSDLAFPHHEMCAAQARCATAGAPFAGHHVHSGMVGWAGQKMSKSLGNLVLVAGLVAEGADPMAIRLALLAHHYRQDWHWQPDDLRIATRRLVRWRAADALDRVVPARVLASVRERLADDLDVPGVLDLLDAWVAQLRGAVASGDAADRVGPTGPSLGLLLDTLLGVRLS